MEGIAQTRRWSDVDDNTRGYKRFAGIQTKEILEIASSLGTNSHITVRDSHGNATNIIPEMMPENVKLVRKWAGETGLNMMSGIEDHFDFSILHGYHAAGGSGLSPMAHTYSSSNFKELRLNGKLIGEVGFSTLIAGFFHAPVIYVIGDRGAVSEAQSINKNIVGTVTKKFGEDGFMRTQKEVRKMIARHATTASAKFNNNPKQFNIKMPRNFDLHFSYIDPAQAELHARQIHGVNKISDDTVEYQTADFMDLLRTLRELKRKIK